MDRRLTVQNITFMGKGIITNAAIQKDSIIMTIPLEQFITYDKLMDFEDLTWITDHTQSKITQFAFYLAYLQTLDLSPANQNFKTFVQQQICYLTNLPEIFHNLICWTDKQLLQLQDRTLFLKVQNKREKIKNQFHQIVDNLLKKLAQEKGKQRHFAIFKDPQHINLIKFESVLNFYSAIESRNVFFGSLYDPGSQMGALVPTLQYINHSEQPNCEVSTYSQVFIVKSLRQIEPGQQIFVNYGPFSQQVFLQAYGFIPSLQNFQTSHSASSYRQLLIEFYKKNKFI